MVLSKRCRSLNDLRDADAVVTALRAGGSPGQTPPSTPHGSRPSTPVGSLQRSQSWSRLDELVEQRERTSTGRSCASIFPSLQPQAQAIQRHQFVRRLLGAVEESMERARVATGAARAAELAQLFANLTAPMHPAAQRLVGMRRRRRELYFFSVLAEYFCSDMDDCAGATFPAPASTPATAADLAAAAATVAAAAAGIVGNGNDIVYGSGESDGDGNVKGGNGGASAVVAGDGIGDNGDCDASESRAGGGHDADDGHDDMSTNHRKHRSGRREAARLQRLCAELWGQDLFAPIYALLFGPWLHQFCSSECSQGDCVPPDMHRPPQRQPLNAFGSASDADNLAQMAARVAPEPSPGDGPGSSDGGGSGSGGNGNGGADAQDGNGDNYSANAYDGGGISENNGDGEGWATDRAAVMTRVMLLARGMSHLFWHDALDNTRIFAPIFEDLCLGMASHEAPYPAHLVHCMQSAAFRSYFHYAEAGEAVVGDAFDAADASIAATSGSASVVEPSVALLAMLCRVGGTDDSGTAQPPRDVCERFVEDALHQIRALRNEDALVHTLRGFGAIVPLLSLMGPVSRNNLSRELYEFQHPGGPLYPTRQVRHAAYRSMDELFPRGRSTRRLINIIFRLLNPHYLPASAVHYVKWGAYKLPLVRSVATALSRAREAVCTLPIVGGVLRGLFGRHH